MRHRPIKREIRDKDYEYVGLTRGEMTAIGNFLPLPYRNIIDVVNGYLSPEEQILRPTKNRGTGVVVFLLNNRVIWSNHLKDDLYDKRHWMFFDGKTGRYIGLSRLFQYAEEMLVYQPCAYNEVIMCYKVDRKNQKLEYKYHYDLEKISTIFKMQYKRSTIFNCPVEEVLREIKEQDETERVFRSEL